MFTLCTWDPSLTLGLNFGTHSYVFVFYVKSSLKPSDDRNTNKENSFICSYSISRGPGLDISPETILWKYTFRIPGLSMNPIHITYKFWLFCHVWSANSSATASILYCLIYSNLYRQLVHTHVHITDFTDRITLSEVVIYAFKLENHSFHPIWKTKNDIRVAQKTVFQL